MSFQLFTLIFILFIIAAFGEWIVVRSAYRLRLFDIPNARKIHNSKIPRLGGLIVFPVLLIGLFLWYCVDNESFLLKFGEIGDSVIGILMATAVVYICGLFDDLIGIRYRNKFIAQIISGVALCLSGVMISDFNGFLGLHEIPVSLAWPITIFAVIFVSNAFNFIDGIDGLAANLAIIALIYYGCGFVLMAHSELLVLCLFVIVALVVLLMFNMFGNPEKETKVFMGDAGSLSLGVILCGLGTLFLSHGITHGHLKTNFMLAVAPLLLPCFDVIRVVIVRMINGNNIFKADKSHIHHKLLDLGLSQRQSLVLLIGLDMVLLLSTIWLSEVADVNIVAIIEAMFFIGVIKTINRKFKHKQI